MKMSAEWCSASCRGIPSGSDCPATSTPRHVEGAGLRSGPAQLIGSGGAQGCKVADCDDKWDAGYSCLMTASASG